ncbi:MAG: ATP F0F1 synthase subunit B [Pseudomonadota bacterium]
MLIYAGDAFFSLNNTDFVVSLGFILFIGILLHLKVPTKVAGTLDARADTIKAEIDEARALREEAQALLASFERKQKEVAEQSAAIVQAAKADAEAAAAEAKRDLATTLERRLKAADDQIASAEKAAVKEVRDRAASVAIAAAAQVLAEKLGADEGDRMIDASIETVAARLN